MKTNLDTNLFLILTVCPLISEQCINITCEKEQIEARRFKQFIIILWYVIYSAEFIGCFWNKCLTDEIFLSLYALSKFFEINFDVIPNEFLELP